MRKKQILFAFGMAALLLYACVRDELFTDRQQELSNELAVGKNRELTVAAAKEWYVDNGAPVTRMGVTQSNVSGILVTLRGIMLKNGRKEGMKWWKPLCVPT